jgi:two-component system, chemotaxis family, CheB/CheR fusion protein
MSNETNQDFEDLLLFVRENRGFDFTGYKRPSLMRRFERRMQAVGVNDYADYGRRLEDDPDEFIELFDTILINVTSFFRDPASWDYLAQEIVPRIVAAKDDDEIRVWSPGCATGEEAFTVGILLFEALGENAFRDRVKIYATDVDEPALTQGRQATYLPKALNEVPEELRDRYFERNETLYAVRKNLRRAVIFGRHDVINDPPISRVDLLVCRNTLMYFDAQTQGRIIASFHFALNDEGYLFLGKSEALVTRSKLFVPIDLKRRIFARAPGSRPRNLPRNGWGEGRVTLPPTGDGDFGDAGLHHAPVPQLVLDSRGNLVRANVQARLSFGLGQADLGKPLQELEISYRPLDLRSRLDEVQADRRQVTVRDVEWVVDGDARYLDVTLSPLVAPDGTQLGASVSFQDVTRHKLLQTETDHARKEMEAAYEELQSAVEELETTNEELQSTNEELETTNEELQSTNEELETMNEEMQSTNEELETINDEIRMRTDELNETNALMGSILASLGAGMIVIDDDFNVEVWNEAAEDLWGVRADEAEGHHLMNLDIGLPLEELHKPLRAALNGERSELQVPAVNRRGREMTCRVVVTSLQGPTGEPRGAIMLMEPERK